MWNALITPAVIVEEDRLEYNLQQMQAYADAQGVQLRPHIKTHKSLHIGQSQLSLGATGITAARVHEAISFLQGGFKSITVAYPLINPIELDQLLTEAKAAQADLRLIIDSLATFTAIARKAEEYQYTIAIYLKVDVGLHRCGFSSTKGEMLGIAQQIADHSFLELKGLLSHAGHAYGAESRREVAEIAKKEIALLQQGKEDLAAVGISITELSVGATPTLLTETSLNGITEIRPGNYVFMDRTPLSFDLITADRVALSVLATIISENDQFYTLDLGSKTLSSDRGAHGSTRIADYGLVYTLDQFPFDHQNWRITQLSEEHAFVPKTTKSSLHVGQKVRILPNHACVVVNLASHFFLLDRQGRFKTLKIDAKR